MLSRPASISRSITAGTGSCDNREMWMTSGGESACSRNVGIALLDRREEVLVPLERNVRIVAALQQQLGAAEANRLFDLPENLLEAERVALGGPDRTVEGAELQRATQTFV